MATVESDIRLSVPPGVVQNNGAPPEESGGKRGKSGLVPPKRKSNTAWMIAGLALLVISGLSAASIVSSLTDSVDVVVAERPIAEGEIIGEGDLGIAAITTRSGDVRAVPPEQIESLIGLVAAGPVGQGAIVHPDAFIEAAMGVEEDQTVVVGAALDPDQYPRTELRPGDTVRLVETAPQTFVAGDELIGVGTTAREITTGEIVEVFALSGNDFHFSVRIGESSANLVAQRVSEGRLTLVLVEEDSPFESMEALEPNEIPTELTTTEGEADEGGEG